MMQIYIKELIFIVMLANIPNQEEPLEEIYTVVFMDTTQHHVHSGDRIVKRAIYITNLKD